MEDALQSLAQKLAPRSRLQAEIANQAPTAPFVIRQYAADDLQVPLKPLPGGQGCIAQGLFDMALQIGEVAIQDLFGKCLFRAEMVRERAMRGSCGGADIPDCGSVVSGLKHYFEPGVENVFTKRRLHEIYQYARTYYMSICFLIH